MTLPRSLLHNWMYQRENNMENNNNWSKTILSVYKFLPRVTYAFDKLVKSRAYNSFATSAYNLGFNDIMNVANSIINLTQRKNNLINIKVISDKALKSIDKTSAKILIFKYFNNKKSAEIAQILNICNRTYFRKLNVALTHFTYALTKLGYNSYKLQQMLKCEKWIMSVYNTYSTCDDKSMENILDSVEFRNKFQKTLMCEFKKARVG